MKIVILFISIFITLHNEAHAQDHATVNTAQQVSTLRSAMNSFAADTRERVDAMQKELDAFKACAEKNMVYAPKSAQADVHGCLTTGNGCGAMKHGEVAYRTCQDTPTVPLTINGRSLGTSTMQKVVQCVDGEIVQKFANCPVHTGDGGDYCPPHSTANCWIMQQRGMSGHR